MDEIIEFKTEMDADKLFNAMRTVISSYADYSRQADMEILRLRRLLEEKESKNWTGGCQESVSPYWSPSLQCTTETCHRTLPCIIHDPVFSELSDLRAWKKSALESMKQWDKVAKVAQEVWPEEDISLWGQPIQPFIVKVLRERASTLKGQETSTAFLESAEFYELCHRYRNSPAVPQGEVVPAFEALKRYIRGQIFGKPTTNCEQ